MADKSNFTPDEWKLLLQSVIAAGIAVTAADPSGLWGLLKESFAGGTDLAKAKMDPGTNALIKAVVADFSTAEGNALFPSRAWELLLGAILVTARLPDQRSLFVRNCCSMLGLLIIVVAVFLYSETTLFPGLSAVLPTLGAALFIWGRTGDVHRKQ